MQRPQASFFARLLATRPAATSAVGLFLLQFPFHTTLSYCPLAFLDMFAILFTFTWPVHAPLTYGYYCRRPLFISLSSCSRRRALLWARPLDFLPPIKGYQASVTTNTSHRKVLQRHPDDSLRTYLLWLLSPSSSGNSSTALRQHLLD
jgi:hypothetical protein